MEPLRIALAKGRIAQDAIALLIRAGYDLESFDKHSRKLVFNDPEGRVSIVFVKSDDIPVYVEKGAADVGVVGKDVLAEADADIYEMMDLKFGICRMCVAGFEPWRLPARKLVVASKYPNVARRYFARQGIHTEVLKLNGSVELAPIMGLAEVIVDIVETGSTLRENNLHILETLFPVSARLIVNKVSLKTRYEAVQELLKGLREQVNGEGVNP